MFWRAFVRVERAMQFVAIIIVLLLAFVITAEVVSRKVTNASIQGAFETVEQSLVFIVYLGLAYCQSVGGHLRVSALIERAGGRKREIWEAAALCIALSLALVYLWQTGAAGITAVRLQEHQVAMTDFPVWPGKAMVPIGMLFISMRLILQIKTHLSNAFAATPVREEEESPEMRPSVGVTL